MSECRYRALVGVPSLSLDGETKPHIKLDARQPIQVACIEEAMLHWSNLRHVEPYPLPRPSTPDADDLIRRLSRGRRGEFDALRLLAEWGRPRHMVFLTERPAEYAETDSRPFSASTGLLAYSVANPDGYYDSWQMPIVTQWNDVSVETCKLANTSYGTYHDMLYVADVAWFGTTFMPDVAFCAYRDDEAEGGIAYDELFRDGQETKTWEHELCSFYQQRIGLYGTVAMVECVC